MPRCATRACAILIGILSTVPNNAIAATYQSTFGFTFELSDDWLVLTPERVRESYKGESMESLGFGYLGDNVREYLDRAKAGKVEFYFDTKHSPKEFRNNISVQFEPGRAAQPRRRCKRCANSCRRSWRARSSAR